MNTPAEPLPAEVVDELLSADLDGAFDEAARDHGLTTATARALLDRTPGSAERRAALADARRASAVPPLGDETRDLLLARARDAGDDELTARRSRRSRSRTRVAATIAAAAAAVALVVGIGASITSTRDADNDDIGAASDARGTSESLENERDETAATPLPPAGAVAPTYDFGTLTDAQQLRSSVEGALRVLVPQAFGQRLAPDAGAPAPRRSASANADAAPLTSDPCVGTRAAALGAGPPPVARGPVVYAGTPAEVLVFADGDHYVAAVVNDAGGRCELLVTQLVDPQP
jgi:hypothetical protein